MDIPPLPVLSSWAVYGRQALIVFLLLLCVVAAGWFLRAGLWRRGRLALVTLAIFGGLALLSRRVGLGELLVIAVVALVPAMLLLPGGGKKPTAGGRQ